MKIKRICEIKVVIWCGVILILPSHAGGDPIFLIERGYGGRAAWQVNLDGSDPKRISLPHPTWSEFGFAAIGFNHADQKLYWSGHKSYISRSSPNGDNVELIIGPGVPSPQVVDYRSDAHALGFDQQFIYWGAGAEPNMISRLNLAADADIEPIIRSTDHGTPSVTGLAVDSISGRVDWANDAPCSAPGPVCTGNGFLVPKESQRPWASSWTNRICGLLTNPAGTDCTGSKSVGHVAFGLQ
jgi:hypothetical protein